MSDQIDKLKSISVFGDGKICAYTQSGNIAGLVPSSSKANDHLLIAMLVNMYVGKYGFEFFPDEFEVHCFSLRFKVTVNSDKSITIKKERS